MQPASQVGHRQKSFTFPFDLIFIKPCKINMCVFREDFRAWGYRQRFRLALEDGDGKNAY